MDDFEITSPFEVSRGGIHTVDAEDRQVGDTADLTNTASLISLSVFLTNLIFAVIMSIQHKHSDAVIILHEGDCGQIKRINTFFHVGINILSSLLLGASNLCMQLLAAPTRAEVDRAHLKGKWLDIGVPSWRNLSHISNKRKVVWWCLGISSVPLHFIYNSVVSSSLPSYNYAGAVVRESFIHGAPWGNTTNFVSTYNGWPPTDVWDAMSSLTNMQQMASSGQGLINRSKADCVGNYSDPWAVRTNLLIIVEDTPWSRGPSNLPYNDLIGNYSVLDYEFIDTEWQARIIRWVCGDWEDGNTWDLCDGKSHITQDGLDHWTRLNHTVLYCLSEPPVIEKCRLNYSPSIMIAICCFSYFKSLSIVITTFLHREKTLYTLGDAVSSFLQDPDSTTLNTGLASKDLLVDSKDWQASRPMRWAPQKTRWYSAASKRRWALTLSLVLFAIIGALLEMIYGMNGTKKRGLHPNNSSILEMSFGGVALDELTGYFLPRVGTRAFILNVLWANVWQLILAFLYLAYNALLSCQLVMDEWSGYATERKTLRVTHPKGIQRSSYFVSLPMKYGVPLMAANTTLHWLISESIFLVSITTYYPGGLVQDPTSSYYFCGYSSRAILVAICLGVFVVLILIVNAFRSQSNNMPHVLTCSAAMSAACHAPLEDTDAHLLPVQWGIISGEGEVPARCSFTTLRTVRAPGLGDIVLGLPKHGHSSKSSLRHQVRKLILRFRGLGPKKRKF